MGENTEPKTAISLLSMIVIVFIYAPIIEIIVSLPIPESTTYAIKVLYHLITLGILFYAFNVIWGKIINS